MTASRLKLAPKCQLFQEPTQFFLVDCCSDSGKAALPAGTTRSFEWWDAFVKKLLDHRFQQPARTYTISAGAEAALCAAHGREFQQLWKTTSCPPHVISELSLKLMLTFWR